MVRVNLYMPVGDTQELGAFYDFVIELRESPMVKGFTYTSTHAPLVGYWLDDEDGRQAWEWDRVVELFIDLSRPEDPGQVSDDATLVQMLRELFFRSYSTHERPQKVCWCVSLPIRLWQ